MACVEPGFELRRGPAAEAGDLGYLIDRREPQPLDGTELLQQRRLARAADARELIEDALGDSLEPELRVVGVGKPMRLIAHALKELEGGVVEAQPQRLRLARAVNLLELLGETDHGGILKAEL